MASRGKKVGSKVKLDFPTKVKIVEDLEAGEGREAVALKYGVPHVEYINRIFRDKEKIKTTSPPVASKRRSNARQTVASKRLTPVEEHTAAPRTCSRRETVPKDDLHLSDLQLDELVKSPNVTTRKRQRRLAVDDFEPLGREPKRRKSSDTASMNSMDDNEPVLNASQSFLASGSDHPLATSTLMADDSSRGQEDGRRRFGSSATSGALSEYFSVAENALNVTRPEFSTIALLQETYERRLEDKEKIIGAQQQEIRGLQEEVGRLRKNLGLKTSRNGF